MPLHFPFDFKNPDYRPVYAWRMERLKTLRANPALLPQLKAYYREHPAQLIIDFGNTYDPRNVRRGLPAVLPFLLFPKQEELAYWLVDRWKAGEPGLIEKSRDMGITWLVMSLACVLCLSHREMAIGTGSRKEDLVDKLGDPDSMLEKARQFMSLLPREFRGGWDRNDKTCSAFMRIAFPETDSILTGEAGDGIGRGGRKGIYLVDEAAHLERPHLIDAALSANTDCRIDLSSVKGMSNPFAVKRHEGNIAVFTFHWRDDPRKDDAWYEKQKRELDPITRAQEVDMSYNASVEGVVIPAEWVQAAIDAHLVLGIKPSGERSGGLDIADEGRDKNAFTAAHGIVVTHVSEWSGEGSDIFKTVVWAVGLCDELELEDGFKFDSDGLGAGARGDARVINEERVKEKRRVVVATPFRGSEGVFNPDGEDVKGRKNVDYFANRKAQGWWGLRFRFLHTYRAVVEGQPYDPDTLISIPKDLPMRAKLVAELSQPTYSLNNAGKILIDKAPDGSKSPNLADATMIRFANNAKAPMQIDPSVVAALARAGRRR